MLTLEGREYYHFQIFLSSEEGEASEAGYVTSYIVSSDGAVVRERPPAA